MKHRNDRLEDQLRRELALILQREVKDPRVSLATVARINLTNDLSYAEVFVSVLGEEEQREECIRALIKARGFIRSTLAKRIRLRKTPELRFALDRGAEHSQNISDLIDRLDIPKESEPVNKASEGNEENER